jgi:hypothetical protein
MENLTATIVFLALTVYLAWLGLAHAAVMSTGAQWGLIAVMCCTFALAIFNLLEVEL